MLRIINNIFPNYIISKPPEKPLYTAEICISTKNHLFFIHTSSKDIPLNLHKILFSLFSEEELEINCHEAPPMLILQEGLTTYYNDVYIHCPVDFLIEIAKKMELVKKTSITNLEELHKELFRFLPQLFSISNWQDFPEKDLQNIFNHMLSSGLATPKMFSLFFEKVPLANLSNFFSKRIAQEISEETPKEPTPLVLLDNIYYIIERNLIIYLEEKKLEGLKFYHDLISYYYYYFMSLSLKDFDLSKLFGIQKLINKNSFSLFINKIPHSSLLSFLQHSLSSNQKILAKAFSSKGFERVLDDLDSVPHSILLSKNMLYALAQLEYMGSAISINDLVSKNLLQERDWEFLARMGDMRDLMLMLQSIDKGEKVGLKGPIKDIYSAFENKKIIFPQIETRSIPRAREHCGEMIFYLDFMGFIKLKNYS